MKIAVIPARGGSKRVPRKNIKLFGGKPMIAWPIEAAKLSNCFDKIIVSTDDYEIARIAKIYGADVPFIRPSNLSDDNIGTTPVVAHAIKWFNDHIGKCNHACCIYATAPFILPEDLHRGFNTLIAENVQYAFSVTTYPFPIQRAIYISNNNRVNMFQPEFFNTRSQDLKQSWHDASQFYWGTADAWLLNMPIFAENSAPVILPRLRTQDIDTQEDWDIAEFLFNSMNK